MSYILFTNAGIITSTSFIKTKFARVQLCVQKVRYYNTSKQGKKGKYGF